MSTNPDPIQVVITAQIGGLMDGLAKATAALTASTDAMTSKFSKMAATAGIPALHWSQSTRQAATEVEESFSKTEARHAAHMLGMNRAVGSFASGLPGIGTAMSLAFAPLAIMELVEWIHKGIEKFHEMRDAEEKITKAQVELETTANNSFNTLNRKLIEAEKKADELAGDHLGALRKELQLIDMASMDDLVMTFAKLAQSADATFALMKTSWYSFDSGSDGAKHALDEFRTEYERLLSEGDRQKAAGLLKGTLDSALKVQAAQKTLNDAYDKGMVHIADSNDLMKAQAVLREAGLGNSKKDVEIQNAMVTALRAQVRDMETINTLAAKQKANAVTNEQKAETKDAEKGAQDRNKMLAAYVQESIADYRSAKEEEKRIDEEVETYGERLLSEELNAQERAYKQEEEGQRLAAEAYRKTQQAASEEERGFEADAARKISLARSGSLERIRLAQQEAARIGALYGQESEQYRKAQDRVTAAMQSSRQNFENFFAGITSGFSQAISGMIQGTMTWGEAFRSILSSMTDFLVQESVSMMTKWVADRLYEMIFGKATRSAAVIGASSEYAVNAMASVAAIPVTGWAMAPEVGAAAFALGMAFVPSAAKGWDRVPADTLAAIHKDEMVMSAPLASGLRDLINGGPRQSGGDVHVHFNGVVDAKGFFQQHQGAIVSTIKDAVRNRRG